MDLFTFTCPDCPRGGEGWTSPDALRAHCLSKHADLWASGSVPVDVEIAEQTTMRELAGRRAGGPRIDPGSSAEQQLIEIRDAACEALEMARARRDLLPMYVIAVLLAAAKGGRRS